MDTRVRELIQRAEQITSDTVSRRRIDLVERAVADGHSIEFADLIFDIAEEEQVDPALAFELVLTGIGVRELAPPNDDQWVETQVEAPPAWVTQPDGPAGAAAERHMRTTFRRLRAAFEQHESPRAAVEAFASQPDVAEMKY
ncbi:MAG TPA: hypothetical protein VFZ04_03630 [Longimicrobiales bacterium]